MLWSICLSMYVWVSGKSGEESVACDNESFGGIGNVG